MLTMLGLVVAVLVGLPAGAAYATGSWAAHTSGTTNVLDSVAFTDAAHGWALGGGGIIKTTSTDSVWTAQPSGRGNYLTAVDFVSPSTGWAVGGHAILKTTNGGQSWIDQSSNGPIEPPSDAGVDFVDALTGWVVGGDQILKTTDGGASWTIQSIGASYGLTLLNSVHFVDANTGWVVGWGGGAGTMNGIIYKTTNGGATWNSQNSEPMGQLFSVTFVDADNGWAAGDGSTIVHTTNGGTTWIAQTAAIGQDYKSIQFIDASNGWAVGMNGGIIHTANGGATWSAQASGLAAGTQLRSVCFVDVLKGWAVGYAPGGQAPILSTTDSGTTWTAGSWPPQEWLFSIHFFDATTGWAVGWGGTIIHLGALPDPTPVATFTITPSAGAHGSISPPTQQTVSSGGSQAFTITANAGYHVADVLVDGVSVGVVTSHTFTNVIADHTISATFKRVMRLSIASDRATSTGGRAVAFKGTISPNVPNGTHVTVWMRKSTSSMWTKLSTRHTFSSHHWSYTLSTRTRKHGTYYVQVRYAGSATLMPATSASKKLVIK
jgi:photosystem II stability/assembly factor-like uncharacterized protein